jgi:glutamine synthetase
LNGAIQAVLAEIMEQHGAVVFNGDGYTEDWHREAEKRGLPNYKTSVDALPVLEQPEVVALFDKYKVLNPRELHARHEIFFEQYIKAINVEQKLTTKLAKTLILPAALRYQTELANNAIATKGAGISSDNTLLTQVSTLIGGLQTAIAGLEKAASHHGASSLLEEAKYYKDSLLPAMLKVREVADTLETVLADDIWPLPTYQEMLFIK